MTADQMNEQMNEVWAVLDRERLASVARQGPEPIFATISGAHLYGFASPDSDVDLRGAFLLPARAVLGLHPPDETITNQDKSTVDLDWVAHDVRKFARMMTNHNGYVLEQLFSPLVVLSTPAHEELRELGKGCVTRATCATTRDSPAGGGSDSPNPSRPSSISPCGCPSSRRSSSTRDL